MGVDVLAKSKKNLLQILKITQKMNVKSFEVSENGLKVEFFEEKTVWKDNSRKKISKSDKELLEKIQKQAEIDELRLVDPAGYEEKLALGELVDEE